MRSYFNRCPLCDTLLAEFSKDELIKETWKDPSMAEGTIGSVVTVMVCKYCRQTEQILVKEYSREEVEEEGLIDLGEYFIDDNKHYLNSKEFLGVIKIIDRAREREENKKW